MNDWLALLLISLAAMRVIETLKELIPWPLQPWTKGVLAMLLGLTGTWLLADGQDWERLSEWIVFGLGAGGLASILHEVRSVLMLLGDTFKVEVIAKASGRRR